MYSESSLISFSNFWYTKNGIHYSLGLNGVFMQVVILAGGLGTRLSEETTNIPKPMVKIGSIPILIHLMKYFTSFGHNEFVIALGYKGEIIKEYFLNYINHNSSFEINMEDSSLTLIKPHNEKWNVKLIDTGLSSGTGGRILQLKEFLQEQFLMTYGDGLSDVNLNQLVNFHNSSKTIATVTAVRPPSRFGSLKIEHGIVSKFAEKLPEEAGWINGGFFCLQKNVCDFISSDDEMFEFSPLEKIVKQDQLAAFKHEGFWQSMDTMRDKIVLENIWSQGNAPWIR